MNLSVSPPVCFARRSLKRRRAAFTLVEMVIVVLIVGIMAAVAVPRYADALSWYRVDAAARRIEVDLKLARRRAKISSAGQSVQFDPMSHSYILPDVPHLDHSGMDYQVELENSSYATSIVSADFGGDAQLLFDGFGVPDSAGTVVVQSGRYQRKITVDPDTGEASMQ